MIQSQNIHRKSHGAVEDKAEPDAAVLVADPAEEDACDDGGKCFGHRFLKMNHAIRHGHREDRICTECRFEAVNHKASEKELEPKKLEKIYKFPDEKR